MTEVFNTVDCRLKTIFLCEVVSLSAACLSH
jgi:hypothetical protein